MDNLTEFVEILTVLACLYPRFDLTKETIKAYYAILQDIDTQLLKAATLQIGATSKWFPSASEIREAAFELIETESGIPTPGEAWAEALQKVNIYTPPEYSHPLIEQAVNSIGGNRVLGMTHEDMIAAARARFLEAYKTLLARERYQTRMLPEVRAVAKALSANRSPAIEEKKEKKELVGPRVFR